MPLTVGGGVRTVDDVRALLKAGADKVSINTAAVARPDSCARRRSASARSASSSRSTRAGASPTTRGAAGRSSPTAAGRRPVSTPSSGRRRMDAAGAGEILLTSMDRDGTQHRLRSRADARRRRPRSASRSSPRAAPARSSICTRDSRGWRERRARRPRSSTTASTPCARRRRTWRRAASPYGCRRCASGWLTDTAVLYARVFKRGALLALRSWAVGLVLVLYVGLLGIAVMLAAPLGIVGGLLIYVATCRMLQLGALPGGAGSAERARAFLGPRRRLHGLPERSPYRVLPHLGAAIDRVRSSLLRSRSCCSSSCSRPSFS